MRLMLVPFIMIAAVGLVLSFIVHFCVLFGLGNPFGGIAWVLHPAIFIVWIPTVIISKKLTEGTKPEDFWKVALRGSPQWMNIMTSSFLAYAVINFIIFIVIAPKRGDASAGVSGTPDSVFRGFSGHWMAFYSAALATLYSAFNVLGPNARDGELSDPDPNDGTDVSWGNRLTMKDGFNTRQDR